MRLFLATFVGAVVFTTVTVSAWVFIARRDMPTDDTILLTILVSAVLSVLILPDES